jgi:hypothetical protein
MSNFEIETFIRGWFIDTSLCDDIIGFFNQNEGLQVHGQVIDNIRGKIVDHNIKNSKDMPIDPDNADIFPLNRYHEELYKVIDKYKKHYSLHNLKAFDIVETYNIQYYPPGGGFKKYHWERLTPNTKHRQFVFMTYLNDVPNGGTEFKYQGYALQAKKGLTLIWPSDWTHTHRGVISQEHNKYIVTGWLGFKE